MTATTLGLVTPQSATTEIADAPDAVVARATTADPSPAPSLDRDSDVWVGTLPGLGSVRVHPDGAIEVTAADRADDDADTVELRERALRLGWGEALSFARRGFRQSAGAAVGPVDGDTCMLLMGDAHDVAIVLIELVGHGWAVLGDRPTPLVWDSPTLTAHPRSAPVVVSKRRAAKADLEGTRLRGDTDAVALELPRITEPRRVAAIVAMQMRKPDEVPLTPLAGHERFELAASLFMGGAPWPVADEQDATDESDPTTQRSATASELMSDHLALARLPAARLRFDSATKDDDIAALLAWWLSLAEAP